MHASPSLAPPVHVFTHKAPAPYAFTHGVTLVQAVIPHGTVDGHGHGPLDGYVNCFTAIVTLIADCSAVAVAGGGTGLS